MRSNGKASDVVDALAAPRQKPMRPLLMLGSLLGCCLSATAQNQSFPVRAVSARPTLTAQVDARSLPLATIYPQPPLMLTPMNDLQHSPSAALTFLMTDLASGTARPTYAARVPPGRERRLWPCTFYSTPGSAENLHAGQPGTFLTGSSAFSFASLTPSAPADSAPLIAALPLDYRGYRLSTTFDSWANYVETPFGAQTRVPVAALWGGRVQLSGFDDSHPMENILLGLPVSGGLPPWSVGTQSHPGIWAPEADESYGIRLTIGLGRDTQADQGPQVWYCLARVVGVRRACHL